MISALSSGLGGMQAMQASVDTRAARIAASSLPVAGASSQTAPTNGEFADLSSDLLGMKESVLLYKANAETVQAVDEALGSLLSLSA